MELNISITIADDAAPSEIAAAMRAAILRCTRLMIEGKLPEVDADQHDIGQVATHFGVPRSFQGVFYRSA